MKKFLILILAFFAFWMNGNANFDDVDGLKIDIYTVSATTGSVDGKDPFVTEIYYWDTTTASYKLKDRSNAHIKLEVPVKVIARGKSYFSVWSAGDLHRYSSAYHPADESPAHVSPLNGDSDTGVKVSSGWPIIIFKGIKSKTVTAKGTLVTDTSNKYELKGKGKLDTSKGGGSGSARGVGIGTGSVSSSGGWTHNATSWRVGVLDIRPSHPSSTTSGVSTPPSGGSTPPTDNTPNCSDCTSHCSSPCSCSTSGTCNGTVVDNTPNCSDCTDGCSSCPTGGSCGMCNTNYRAHEASEHEWFWPPCGRHGNYKCLIEGDHSLQSSCPRLDEWGRQCTVTNFYACDNHTCDF